MKYVVHEVNILGDGTVVCRMKTPEPGDAWAAARLMGAAPELLEALSAMVSCQIETWPIGVFERARAVIKKATGG